MQSPVPELTCQQFLTFDAKRRVFNVCICFYLWLRNLQTAEPLFNSFFNEFLSHNTLVLFLSDGWSNRHEYAKRLDGRVRGIAVIRV